MDILKTLFGIAMGPLLVGCVATYESAQKQYDQGDIEKASATWLKLAYSGDAPSMYQLYSINPIKENLIWLQRSASQGDIKAQKTYGEYLFNHYQYQKSKQVFIRLKLFF